jgi:hypothetical protein
MGVNIGEYFQDLGTAKIDFLARRQKSLIIKEKMIAWIPSKLKITSHHEILLRK